MRRGTVQALILAALFAPGTAALAADPPSLNGKPFVLSDEAGAQRPNVAVDDNGTGHFAWDVDRPYPETDPLVYCRVPRGATACQATQRFTLPLEAFGNPVVLTPAPGQVILLAHRCCGGGQGNYAVVSTDGGTTFAPPHLISGDQIEIADAVYGPGEGAVSLVDDVVSGGTHYQAAPLDGYTEATANVGDGPGPQGYDGTIGFPSPTTPLVAFDDLTTGFFRLWSGHGDVNDLATWQPTQTIGPVTDLRIATGIKGVVLMGREDIVSGSHKYTARRFDTTTNTFRPPVTISDPKVETDVIFRDIYEDGGGNVAAVFIANGVYNGGKREDPIRYRASIDGGKTWGPEKTLLNSTSDSGYHLQIGAAPDGGGWVAFDANSDPPLKAVAIPPLAASGAGGGGGGGGGLPCQGVVSFGKVQAIATAGCLQKQKDGTYRTSDPVRLNGLDLVPHTSGRRAHAAATASIEVDPVHKKVHIDGADVKAGPVVLDKGSFDWDVSSGSLSNVTTFAHLEKFDVHIFGFPVVGEASLQFDDKGAFIPAHLGLPSIFGGVTADVTLRLKNPGGLKLEGFKLHVGEVFLGALRVKPLDVEYKGSEPPVFEGSATFLLPPSYSAPGAHVSFGFVNGKFKHAEGSLPFDPPLGLSPPWVYLKQIGLALSTDPLQIAGGVELIGGPQVFGKQAVSIDALPPANGFSFTFGDPAVLRISGAMSVVDVPFAHGFVEFRTNGLFKFGGGLDFTVPLGLASITAGVPEGPPLGPGFVDLSSGKFNAPFEGDVCVPAGCDFIDVGSQGVISSNGIAACGEYIITSKPKVGVSAGFGYHWGGDADIFGSFGGCDVSDYAVSAPSKRRQAGPQTVDVPAGLPQENFVVVGITGAPSVTVTAPDGETAGTPGKSTHMVVVPNAAAKATLVMIGSPVAGRYTITPASGSSPIAKVGHANGLPEPKVTAKLGGGGYHRTLQYTITPITGQTVRFLERSAGAGADLGAAKGTSGTLRFTPADGAKGTRQIVADVSQNGLPRRQIVVATYVAPGPRAPGRPAFVKLRRAGSRVKVRWGSAARAASYVVRVRLHDGTSRLYVRPAKARSFTLPSVPTRTFGTVSVQAVSKTGVKGPARKAGVKRKRAKKKRH